MQHFTTPSKHPNITKDDDYNSFEDEDYNCRLHKRPDTAGGDPCCPSCGGTEFEEHDASGMTVRANDSCGRVLIHGVIQNTVEYTEDANGVSKATVQH